MSRRVSRVGVAGSVIVLAALLFGDFVLVRPNRLAPGQPLSLFAALPFVQWAVCLVPPLLLVALSWQPTRRRARLGLAAALAAVYLLLWFQGTAATALSEQGGAFTRVSMGSGLWFGLLGLFIVCTDLYRRSDPGLVFKLLLFSACMAGVSALALSGVLDRLSLVLEFHGRNERFWAELSDHLFITGMSVGASVIVGLPLGLAAYRVGRFRTPLFSLLNVVQTIPSLALFGLLIAPLAWLSNEVWVLREIGVRGIGWAPAVVALSLYALLPIVRNTYAGFAAVGAGVLEAGRGMGMGRLQLFWRVELPVASPIICNGVRIACVQNIGNTAVAALIGAGGFGVFIFQGLGQSAIDLVLLGAVPTIVLAVLVDFGFQAVISLLTPRGLS